MPTNVLHARFSEKIRNYPKNCEGAAYYTISYNF